MTDAGSGIPPSSDWCKLLLKLNISKRLNDDEEVGCEFQPLIIVKLSLLKCSLSLLSAPADPDTVNWFNDCSFTEKGFTFCNVELLFIDIINCNCNDVKHVDKEWKIETLIETSSETLLFVKTAFWFENEGMAKSKYDAWGSDAAQRLPEIKGLRRGVSNDIVCNCSSDRVVMPLLFWSMLMLVRTEVLNQQV